MKTLFGCDYIGCDCIPMVFFDEIDLADLSRVISRGMFMLGMSKV